MVWMGICRILQMNRFHFWIIFRKVRQIPIQTIYPAAFVDPLCQLPYNTRQPCRLLSEHLFSKPLCGSFDLLPKPFYPFLLLFLCQNNLNCRVYGNLLQLLYRALAFQIKGANRIYLCIPKLNSYRLLLCKRINIQDSAPYGKDLF